MKKSIKTEPTSRQPERKVKTKKTNSEVAETQLPASEPVIPTSFALPPRLTIAVGLSVAVLALIAGLLYSKYWNVAIVNGQPISRLDYIKAMEVQVGKQTLEKMITDTLILDAAKKQNVTVDANTLAEEISKIEEQLKQQGQTLDDALAQENMTRADLEELLKVQKLAEIMGQGEVNITEEQIDQYLKNNKDSIPANQKPEELRAMAKEQLGEQTKSENIRNWLTDLRAKASINYQQ